ncbi:MAG TPA: creatininase family protein [Bacillota bacterium]|nr:creatininase family protein [Bacillota bacterium]HOK69599.1 creatininase family protein [Bacillota bacterium]HPP85967.1 creatininase family protein [Bacillota bacterium]
MNWEKVNVLQFKDAIEKSKGVCVIPIGCLEKHGYHLPLGTDLFIAREICERAAEKEEFMIFPYYPFGQVSEVRHKLGTVALPAVLQLQILEALCAEISRNGFKKIVFANGHGGNNYMLAYFAQSMLDKIRDYDIYTVNVWHLTEQQYREVFAKHRVTPDGGHADITETSQMMAIDASLVHMELLDRSETASLGRSAPYTEKGIYNGFCWYADYPHQIAGDPCNATKAFGQDYLELCVDNFTDAIRLIKNDSTLPFLAKEFYEKAENPSV